MQKLLRWLRTNVTGDRILALIGVSATIILGILGILASAAREYFQFALILIFLLMVLSVTPLIVLIREPRHGRIRIPPFPYRNKTVTVTTDITAADGTVAVIRREEEIVCLGDYLSSLRHFYWGAWDESQLNDYRSVEPKGAEVVDMYMEGYQTTFLTSLRHLYNAGDTFMAIHELTVRNGFTDPEHEFMEWTNALQVDTLVMKIVLPQGKVLIPGSPKLRLRLAANYDEIALPNSAVTYTEDGRYQILWSISKPKRSHHYSIRWTWKDGL